MADDPQPKKIPLIFFRTLTGSEPVREWLKELPEEERQAIGKDLLRAQWRWPVGMPLCRAMGSGLWEIRTDLPTRCTARVLLCVYREHLVALHGFIKRHAQRQKRIWLWRGNARRSWSNEQETHGFERR
jgi:phage-related protein